MLFHSHSRGGSEISYVRMERKILQNTFLPSGLSSALKIFTKIVKPVLKEHSLLLPQLDSLLLQPHREAVHPFSKRLQPRACKVSGNPSSNELFQAKPPTAYCSPGQLWHEFCSKRKVNANRTVHLLMQCWIY